MTYDEVKKTLDISRSMYFDAINRSQEVTSDEIRYYEIITQVLEKEFKRLEMYKSLGIGDK